MTKKPGPRRRAGRPEVVRKRAKRTGKQQARRERIRGYGLERVELWLAPGELDALRDDTVLRVYEMDLMHAVTYGDAREVLMRRVLLEDQRRHMGLPALAEDDLVIEITRGVPLRALNPANVPRQAYRPKIHLTERGSITVQAARQLKPWPRG